MSFNLTSAPTKFLAAKVIAGTALPIDYINDESSQFNGFPRTFQVEIYAEIQTHSYGTTRAPFMYDTNDINQYDWLAQPSGKTYKILEVVQVIDQQTAILIIEDESLVVLIADPSQQGNNYPDEDQFGAIFSLDEAGNPLLSGIANQAAQFPGLTYWIEDIKSRFDFDAFDEEGVETDADLDQSMDGQIYIGTNGNASPTGVTIEYTPFADSRVDVKINGISVNLGNGILTKDCYFSNDEGLTPKLIKDIEAGDMLYWNGENAGYELDPIDDIDFEYEASNLDI